MWGEEVDKNIVPSLEACCESCDSSTNGCVSFEYSTVTRQCALYTNKDDMVFWPNVNMTYYEQTRCRHHHGRYLMNDLENNH